MNDKTLQSLKLLCPYELLDKKYKQNNITVKNFMLLKLIGWYYWQGFLALCRFFFSSIIFL